MREKLLEAEQSVLGGVLLDNGVWPIAAEQLRADDFTDPRHRAIWSAMTQLAAGLEPIDEVMVASWLQQRGKADSAGGPLYLAELAERVPTAANIASYVTLVRKAGAVRRLYKTSRDALKAIEEGAESEEVFDAFERAKAELRSREPNKIGDVTEDLGGLLSEMEHRQEQGAAVPAESYISTGYESIDRKIIGLGKAQLVIVSAKSGVGKTAIVLNTASRQVVAGRRVAFFSGEMGRKAIARRILASAAKINHHVLRKGIMAADDWPRALRTQGQIKRGLFLINDQITTITEVCNVAYRTHLESPLDVVYVDYLQHLVPRMGARENREVTVAQAAADLKNLARKLGAPVICLSQLNADGGLRESQAIYHVADVVLEVERPGADNPDADKNEATLHIRKQRDGEIGSVPLLWHGQYVRFDEYAELTKPSEHFGGYLEKSSRDD